MGADIAGEAGRTAESGLTATSRLTRNFEHSQAYYLYVVRAALREAGVLKVVRSANDASDLRSGDFVEYQATFRPNEISALRDILTPDLIAAITHYAGVFPLGSPRDSLNPIPTGTINTAEISDAKA